MSNQLPSEMLEVSISRPGGPEVLKQVRSELPSPKDYEVLVRVHAAGVNRPDVIQRQGKYPMPPGVNPIPGLEVAGEVIALGKGASRFSIGDMVCGLTEGGGYAEYCVLKETQTLPIPSGLTPIQAAAIPETFFTVWANLFQIANATKGQSVLIHGGTSGIGTTALMLCQAFGISTFSTAGSESKCSVIEKLGGTPINYKSDNFVRFIEEATDGKGVNIILDIMGGSYFNDNIGALAKDGTLVIIGFLGGTHAESADLQSLVLKRAHVTGSTMRARTSKEKAEITASLYEHVWPKLSAGKCLPLIHQVVPLNDAAEAHRIMEEGHHVGKIVLSVTG